MKKNFKPNGAVIKIVIKTATNPRGRRLEYPTQPQKILKKQLHTGFISLKLQPSSNRKHISINLFSFTNLHMFRVFRYKMRRIIFRYGNVRSLLRFFLVTLHVWY
jgi:hypothetical protein